MISAARPGLWKQEKLCFGPVQIQYKLGHHGSGRGHIPHIHSAHGGVHIPLGQGDAASEDAAVTQAHLAGIRAAIQVHMGLAGDPCVLGGLLQRVGYLTGYNDPEEGAGAPVIQLDGSALAHGHPGAAGIHVAVFRGKAHKAQDDPDAAAILERSESIYRQAVEHYNQTLRKPWVCLPAALMGFRMIENGGEDT